MSKPAYVPPKVWRNEAASGGQFASINRPVAGPTHDKDLPLGKHPLQLYSLATPNGVKVTIALEELLALGHTAAEYDAWLIRIGEGDQFSSGFVQVNPNSKIPALLDRSVEPAVRVFESGSILLYLADKFGALLPKSPATRTESLNWLFWQMGAAPYLGGGFGHFYVYAPEKFEYAINRFTMEPSVNWTCLTAGWPRAATWAVMSTALPILPCGRGMASWCAATCMTRQNSWRWMSIPTYSAGPRKLPSARRCSAELG